MSTLRYADNAKKIKNKPKVNEDPKDALLRQFQEQLDALKKQLAGEGGEQSEEESGTEESSSEEETGEVGWDGKKIKKPKKPKGTKGKRKKIVKRPISPSKIKQIQAEIEREKGLLHSDKTMASELKAKAESDLAQREAELAQQLERRQELQQQMDDVAKKVIVGGVNLLEKAEEQQKLLDSAQEELAKRQAEQEQIQRDMEDIEMEEIQIEEQYSSLQEEVAGKTKKLKQVWTRLMAAKADIADMQADHERQTEGIVDNINVLSRQLTLCHLIIDNFIPPEHQVGPVPIASLWPMPTPVAAQGGSRRCSRVDCAAMILRCRSKFRHALSGTKKWKSGIFPILLTRATPWLRHTHSMARMLATPSTPRKTCRACT